MPTPTSPRAAPLSPEAGVTLVEIIIAMMVFGFIAFFAVDRYTLYDIDFTGGHKVQMGF